MGNVTGGGGTHLHVRQAGPADAPTVVFVHGWSQNSLSWVNQLHSELAQRLHLVAFDLRGHGMSEAPTDDAAYSSGDLWAADLAAVIDQLGLHRPVVVAWSFGGFVVADYLRVHGDHALGGVNLVGTSVALGDESLLGRGFRDHYRGAVSDDLAENIAAMRGFVRACTSAPLSQQETETMLSYNMVVPPAVRRAVSSSRKLDFSAVFGGLTVPVLVSHGTDDQVALLPAVDGFRRCLPDAQFSIYEDTGHAPFLEAPDRFNRELEALVARTTARPSVPGGV